MPIHQTTRQSKSPVQWQPPLPPRRPPPPCNNGRKVEEAGAEMAEEEAVEAEAEEEAVAEAAAEEVHPVDNLPLRPQSQHQEHLTTEGG